ncbi:MAG: hypothetical protein FJ387_00810 [Verrucomicrobia bacterium]|nr:hypothetical protein [Verrucomicrobiota bacterium]
MDLNAEPFAARLALLRCPPVCGTAATHPPQSAAVGRSPGLLLALCLAFAPVTARSSGSSGFVDALARNAGQVAWLGANTTAVSEQTLTQTVPAGVPAVYELQAQLIVTTPDAVTLAGPAALRGWNILYFDESSGGQDVTREVTAPGGYLSARSAPGGSRQFRVEVTPGPNVPGDAPWEILVHFSLATAPARRDTVRFLTTVAPRTQPDLTIRRRYDLRYAGDGVYNPTGTRQTKAQETDPDVPAIYHLALANDGNFTDQFTLRGEAGSDGWTVRYFDALVGGREITAEIVGPGWTPPPLPLNGVREVRLEVSGAARVQGVSLSQVLVTAVSHNDPARTDTVRARTAIIPDSTFPVGGVYTADEDFEKGILMGVSYEIVPDQLQPAREPLTLPFLWVPNSNEGTVSKVDTRTGEELARYRTGPAHLNGNPSRTTIDQQGNCWVANRHTGTALKIGLFEGGQYQDRNRDGLVQTSQDRNGDGDITGEELLPWGADECVLWEVVLLPGEETTNPPGAYLGRYADDNWSPGPRGVAIDAQGNVWLGTYGSQKFYHVDGASGRIRHTIDFASVPHHSYGAVIDAQGILWSSSLNDKNLLRLDPRTGAFAVVDVGHTVYGLGLDRDQHLFIAGWKEAKLSRLNVLTGLKDWTVPGVFESRGVAVTEDGDVWTADSAPGTLTRWSNDGRLKATIAVGAAPTGVTVDAAGKVWVVNNGDEFVKRINPLTDQVDLEKRILGGRHYGYSDMTGIVSRTATTRFGVWSLVHDSRFPGATWGAVSWQAHTPPGTSLHARARSSPNRQTWSAWESVTNGDPLQQVPPGKFLHLEITLQTLEDDGTPILYDLTVTPEDDVSESPLLAYRRIEPRLIELLWDTELPGIALESAPQLAGPWTPVPEVVGPGHRVRIETDQGSSFFRLRLQPWP